MNVGLTLSINGVITRPSRVLHPVSAVSRETTSPRTTGGVAELPGRTLSPSLAEVREERVQPVKHTSSTTDGTITPGVH